MRVNVTITITAGTPFNCLTGLSSNAALAAALASSSQPRATRFYFQVLSGTGDVYVMGGIYGVDGAGLPRVPSSASADDVTAILAFNTNGPPVTLSDTAPAFENSGIDIGYWWIDGSHTGDVVKISYDRQD